MTPKTLASQSLTRRYRVSVLTLLTRCYRVPVLTSLPLVLILALPVLFPLVASAAETPKKVLIFSGTDPSRPAILQLSEILRSTLDKDWPGRVQFYSEGLDSNRIPAGDYEQEMVKLLQRKYEGQEFDLIFALGSPGFGIPGLIM